MFRDRISIPTSSAQFNVMFIGFLNDARQFEFPGTFYDSTGLVDQPVARHVWETLAYFGYFTTYITAPKVIGSGFKKGKFYYPVKPYLAELGKVLNTGLGTADFAMNKALAYPIATTSAKAQVS